ncbi:MAG: amino acid adenylation domain-containing protein [Bacteroidota bacterium]
MSTQLYLLHQSLDVSAAKFPDKLAFKSGKHAVSYSEMHKKSGQLARLLIELGVKKGDRVGIYTNRSLESVIGVYGILRAGAIFVPLDPTAPDKRTLFLIQDCGIQYLISQSAQRKKLARLLQHTPPLRYILGLMADWEVPCIDWQDIWAMPELSHPIRMVEKDLAYIMYTSGSTGQPKGIMHSHFSGLRYARMSADLYEVHEEDLIGTHAPLHFDISTFGYFTAPLVGATSVIIPDAYIILPASLSQLIEKEALSIWYSVPLALIRLLTRGVLDQRDLSSLRWVLFGGEPFPVKHLKALMELWPHARFSNVYGPAEINQCTYYHLPAPPSEEESIPLGTLCANTEMRILDEHDQPVRPDETGELLVRTSTMMTAYWNQPHLTQQGFYIEEPHPGYQETFYRTGDLVRINEKGDLMFLGRKDRQVKLKSYRVELDEIEAVLVAHEAVEEAAIVAIRKEDSLHIEGAVIMKVGDKVNEASLLNHMSQYVPSYAVPEQIHILQTLPYTTSGKINYPVLAEQVSMTQEST